MTTISEPTAAQMDRWRPTPHTGRPRIVALSPMLVNVLDSLCEGKPNAAIAEDWGISEDTVKTHLKRLFRALGARDRVHAVVLVLAAAVDVRIKPATGRWAAAEVLGRTPPPPGVATTVPTWL